MQDRINKPKVFLSHSWENKEFVRRIAEDLRRSQIEPWLDEQEIRDGRPWLKMIFEDGIPTCDAVLVYLTKESLNSKMVERELDTAVMHQLREGGVTLLPYVSHASMRSQLRSDLQTLQCREWNTENYHSILPTVIAEIWRSYLERTIDSAVLQEKSRRLEQELENQRLKEQFESSVFSAREDQEFQYLQKQLSKQVELTFDLFKDYRDDNLRRKVGNEVCRVSILRMFLGLMDSGVTHVSSDTLGFHLSRTLGETFLADGHEITRREFFGTLEPEAATRILNELQTYGLAKIRRGELGGFYEITDKMYRFKYWLDYNDLLTDEPLEHVVKLNLEDPQISEQQRNEGRITAELLAADKRIQQARLRKAWRTNGEGTLAVANDIQALFDILKERVDKSSELFKSVELRFDSDTSRCSITTGDLTLTLEGNCSTRNTDDCLLRVSVTAEEVRLGSESLGPGQIFLRQFKVKVDRNLRLKWTPGDGESWSVLKLADYCFSTFLQLIQQNEEKD